MLLNPKLEFRVGFNFFFSLKNIRLAFSVGLGARHCGGSMFSSVLCMVLVVYKCCRICIVVHEVILPSVAF